MKVLPGGEARSMPSRYPMWSPDTIQSLYSLAPLSAHEKPPLMVRRWRMVTIPCQSSIGNDGAVRVTR